MSELYVSLKVTFFKHYFWARTFNYGCNKNININTLAQILFNICESLCTYLCDIHKASWPKLRMAFPENMA